MITQEKFNQIVKLALTVQEVERKAAPNRLRIDFLKKAIASDNAEIRCLESALQDTPDDKNLATEIVKIKNLRDERFKRLNWYPNVEKAYINYVKNFNKLKKQSHPHIKAHQWRDIKDDSYAAQPYKKAKMSNCFLDTLVDSLNECFETEYEYIPEQTSSHDDVPVDNLLSSITSKPDKGKQKENVTNTSSSPSLRKNG